MNQATIFHAGQQNIWADDEQALYDDWHNANDTARALGAKETGREQDNGDDTISEWEFPDGSKTWIGRRGSSLNADPTTFDQASGRDNDPGYART